MSDDQGPLNTEELRAPWIAPRPALRRPAHAPAAGVCAALARHLGGHVDAWRAGFVGLTIVGFGIGIPLYLLAVLVIPKEDETVKTTARLRPRLQVKNGRVIRRQQLLLAGVLCVIAVVLTGWTTAVIPLSSRQLALILIAAGAAIIWSARPGDDGPPATVMLITGGAGVVIGVLMLISTDNSPRALIFGTVSTAAAIVALSLTFYPHVVAGRHKFRAERDARIRAAERTAIAAHLHDSVLQTLALIRSRADDAEEVRALARAQERDLRRYLYADREGEATSAATKLAGIAANIEDRYRQEISVVITGDTTPTTEISTLLAAVSEALTNACKHAGGAPISLYGELGETRCEIWVRDRGPGFDPQAIAPDREGIRTSIRARMESIGGRASIRSPLASGGTEVHLAWQEQ
ncbi:MAG: ATP-binding protein [Bowdeniella nasicola]|nr:ATP-binding protein [Bowdeniella nasicola]